MNAAQDGHTNVRLMKNMKSLPVAVAVVAGFAFLVPTSPAAAVSNKSGSGHYYKPGEFCPKADLGKTITDPYGTMTCKMKGGRPHWERS